MWRRYRTSLRSLGQQKGVFVLAVVIVIVLMNTLLPLRFGLNARDKRLHSEDRPRYLHHSTFRAEPDYRYETKLSKELRELEIEGQLRGNATAPQKLWQIMLGQTAGAQQRGEDSILFQEKNSDWEYMLVTSEWADNFVTETLASIPDLAYLYKTYPHNVLRADLLRYLILWYYGGYYSDMDIFPARSIKSCPALRDAGFTDTVDPDISLVIGVEIDEPFASPQKMHDWHWVRSYGFVQYTMYAPQRFSPLLREIIVRVLSHTRRHIDQSNFFIGARYNELATLEITGPGVFTDAILDVLSDTLPTTHPLIQESVKADAGLGDMVPPSGASPIQRVTWAPFYRLKLPRCIKGTDAKLGKQLGGLCVLPVNSWGNGQRHSEAEGFDSHQACVNHRFGGTWKPWKQSWQKYLLG